MALTQSETRIAGIMAAGRGRRLAAPTSKPLALVGGTPLIDHVLTQCLHADIEEVIVVISTDDVDLADHLSRESRFVRGVHHIRVPSGSGTGVAVHALVREIGPVPCLISTADTIAPPGAYRRLLDYARTVPAQTIGVILGTAYVRDADPIWIHTDGAGRLQVMSKGIQATGLVFANVRWLSSQGSERIASMTVEHGARDMSMMAALLRDRTAEIRVFLEAPVFDIDDRYDLEDACRWLREASGGE